MLVLWLGAPLIARATGAPVADMIRAMALLLPFSAAAGMLSALVLRERRYRLLASRVLICQPLAVGTGVLAALGGAGAWSMAAQQATATLSVFLLLALRSGWRPQRLFQRAALAELWPVAGPQILALLVFNGRYRIFIVGLGMLVAETVVAVTHIAFRLLDVAMAVVTGAASRLAMPRLAALQNDRPALAEAYGDLAQLQALIGLPIAAGLAITAPRLIEILMGGPWIGAAEPARLVALAAIPGFLVGPAPALWLALGRTRMNLLMQLVAFTLPLVGLLLLRPQDAAAAAFCWVARQPRGPAASAARHAAGAAPLPGLAGAAAAGTAAGHAGDGRGRRLGGAGTRGAGGGAGLLGTALAGAIAYAIVVTPALGFRWPRALQEADSLSASGGAIWTKSPTRRIPSFRKYFPRL